MKQKKITFTNEEGAELVGLLDLPEDEKPVAYALFAHCFTCTKNLASAANICRPFPEDALRFFDLISPD